MFNTSKISMLMISKFDNLQLVKPYLIVCSLIIITIINFYCSEKPHACELKSNQINKDSITLRYPNDITVTYQVNKNFSDISSSIIFRYSGPDEVKKYINEHDTLKIEWYWNKNQYEDDKSKKWIEEVYSEEYPSICPQSVNKTYFKQLYGVLSETSCPDPTRMVFIGINEASNYLVVAYYNTNSSNKCAKEDFIAILNSMDFRT